MISRSFLLDTCMLGYLADVKNGSSSAEGKAVEAQLEKYRAARICICPMVAGEVEYGLLVAPFPVPEKQKVAREIISRFECLDVNIGVARDQYGKLRAKIFEYCAPGFKKRRDRTKKRVEELIDPTTAKELGIQENDLWIAAVAMTYNLTLVTHDKMNVIRKAAESSLHIEYWCNGV